MGLLLLVSVELVQMKGFLAVMRCKWKLASSLTFQQEHGKWLELEKFVSFYLYNVGAY